MLGALALLGLGCGMLRGNPPRKRRRKARRKNPSPRYEYRTSDGLIGRITADSVAEARKAVLADLKRSGLGMLRGRTRTTTGIHIFEPGDHGAPRRSNPKPDFTHETANHYAIRVPKGYEIYRHQGNAAVKVATIGFTGEEGLRRVIAEMSRREAAMSRSNPKKAKRRGGRPRGWKAVAKIVRVKIRRPKGRWKKTGRTAKGRDLSGRFYPLKGSWVANARGNRAIDAILRLGRRRKNPGSGDQAAAEAKLAKMLTFVDSGGTLYLQTTLRSWKINKKTVKKFDDIGRPVLKAKGGSLWMLSGKSYVCIDGCRITGRNA